jgi:hypothetical protein
MTKPLHTGRSAATGQFTTSSRTNDGKVVVTTSGQVFRSTRDVLFTPISTGAPDKAPAKK